MFGLHAVKAAIENPNRKNTSYGLVKMQELKYFNNENTQTYQFLISINQKIYQFQKIKFIKELF